jgi:hypothetical protein
MGKFFKELIKGSKWVFIFLGTLFLLIALWLGCAWSIGWTVNHMGIYGPQHYLLFGSCALIFTLIIQAITIILAGWILISYGRSNGFIGKPK